MKLLLAALGAVAGACSATSNPVFATSAPVDRGVVIDVFPKDSWVELAGTVQFEATVTGTTNHAVVWSVEPVDGGSITPSGLYTAPNAVGSARIVAHAARDANLAGSTTIAIVVPNLIDPYAVVPPDRATSWRPGVSLNGGIPSGAWPLQPTVTCANTTADLAAIQNAVNAGHSAHPTGVVIPIAAGTCNLNSGTIRLPSYTALRGAGADATILRVTNGATDNSYTPGAHNSAIVVVGGNASYGTSQALSADAVKGSYSVTMASTSGLSVGQLVLLDQKSGAAWQTDPQGLGQILAAPDFGVVWQKHNPGLGTDDPVAYNASTGAIGNGSDAASWFCRQDRPQNEIKQITAISGSTVTFATPIHLAYRTSRTAQLTPINGVVTDAGVESLALRGGDQGNLRFEGAARSWAKNVDSSHWLNEGIAVNNSYRVEVRDSYLHDACWPVPGGGGYALSIGWGSSEFLLENSISMMANKVMVARSAGSGSVIAYNYFDDGYISGNNRSWAEMGANASHMVGPHHVLFEGNYAWNGDSDKTHGNSTYMTYFRNWLSGYRKSFSDIGGGTWDDLTQGGGPRRAAGPAAFGYWFTFVGNVLGTQGQTSGWVYEDTANGVMTSGRKAIFALGWDDWVSAYPSVRPDPNVASGPRAIVRNGNFDWVQVRQSWDGTPFTIPESLYRPVKPGFFGANPWPWVDPTTGAVYTLPAKARWEAGTPNVVP